MQQKIISILITFYFTFKNIQKIFYTKKNKQESKIKKQNKVKLCQKRKKNFFPPKDFSPPQKKLIK